ncbi:zinc ribbon domain-containing protein [Georgenia sunbinii]|uniref:zinc ribbon domain-containing protein n=1 Tax=Georgenia sunbinii TaxID=3117728 RepID=UPI002F26D7A0
MTNAPVADQRRLLDIQTLDTRASKLGHQRRSLPEIGTLSELDGRVADLERAQVEARTTVSDIRREVTKAEVDVEQVRQRAQRHQARLDSGAVNAKDAQALQGELAQLARRQGDLEEIELEVMERLEEAEKRVAELAAQQAAIEVDIAKHTAARDAQWAVIDDELAALAAQRATAVDALDAGLVKLYDRVRERTGGLAAIALYGSRTEGTQLDFSLSELDAIHSAPPEQVVQHEDYGYIIVRMDEK